MATNPQPIPAEAPFRLPATRNGPLRFGAMRKARQVCLRRMPFAATSSDVSRNEAERNRKIVELLPLLHRIARTMRAHFPAHVQVDDLVSAGTLGLVDAVQKFDARKCVKIETYAQHRIRGAILDSLRSMDGASRDLRLKSRKAEQACFELEARLGRPPSDQELADAQGLSLRKWFRTMEEIKPLGVEWLRPMAMAPSKPATDETLADAIAANQFDLCYRREQREILARAMAALTPRDRAVISLYYAHQRTMKQIGAQLRVDESRVSQLHSAALRRLRNAVSVLTKIRN